jgi:hypothetical protein
MPARRDLCYGRVVTMPREFNQSRTRREVSSTSGHQDSYSSFLPGPARVGRKAGMQSRDTTDIAPTELGNVEISKLMKSEGRS